MTGKLFEYLSSYRPILAIAHPESEIKQVLNHTKAGELLISKQEIKYFISEKMKEKCRGHLFNPNKENTLQYSRDSQFKFLYDKLKSL